MPSKRLVKPSKRHIRQGVPRAQWDALHPGPISQRITPNAVDAHGTRYQLLLAEKETLETVRKVKAWVREPSDEQRRVNCVLCTGRHKPENTKCVALAKSARHTRHKLFAFPSGEPLSGTWIRTRMLVPPRYKSGVCTFTHR